MLCSAAWVKSKSFVESDIFEGSSGSISETVCTNDVTTKSATTVPTCPQCGVIENTGKLSCCAPGGAWFKNCGGANNRRTDYTWIQGMQACLGKLVTVNDMVVSLPTIHENRKFVKLMSFFF